MRGGAFGGAGHVGVSEGGLVRGRGGVGLVSGRGGGGLVRGRGGMVIEGGLGGMRGGAFGGAFIRVSEGGLVRGRGG